MSLVSRTVDRALCILLLPELAPCCVMARGIAWMTAVQGWPLMNEEKDEHRGHWQEPLETQPCEVSFEQMLHVQWGALPPVALLQDICRTCLLHSEHPQALIESFVLHHDARRKEVPRSLEIVESATCRPADRKIAGISTPETSFC